MIASTRCRRPIPHLTRSSLHRLFQRHGISRLPSVGGPRAAPAVQGYPIGYIHIDLAEVWTDEGKLYLFVAIDRVSKFAFAELHERATRTDRGGLPPPADGTRARTGSTRSSPTMGFSSRRRMAAGRVDEIQQMLAARQPLSRPRL